MTVAELLAASRTAHLEYRDAAGKVHSDGSILTLGDRDKAFNAVVKARDYRQQADAADPFHADPDWRNDTAPHADLLQFYDRYIAAKQ